MVIFVALLITKTVSFLAWLVAKLIEYWLG